MNSKTEPVSTKHEHDWIFAGYAEDRCKCGGIRISERELQKRNEEWRAFDAMVRETEAYEDWQALKRAWNEHDLVTVREIAKRAGKRLNEDNYMAHPKFPDPATFGYSLKEDGENGY